MKKFTKFLSLILCLSLIFGLSACKGGGGDGGDPDIENAEELAYSFGKLSSADYYFGVPDQASLASAVLTSNTDKIVEANGPNDIYIEEGSLTWFESTVGMMHVMSKESEKMVDDLMARVTVINKAVVDWNTVYLLTYDEQNDIVTAYEFGFYGALSGMMGIPGDAVNTSLPNEEHFSQVRIIKLYSDDDGNEVVESVLVSYVRSKQTEAQSNGMPWDEPEDYGTLYESRSVYVANKYISFEYRDLQTLPNSFDPLPNGLDLVGKFNAVMLEDGWSGVIAGSGPFSMGYDYCFFKGDGDVYNYVAYDPTNSQLYLNQLIVDYYHQYLPTSINFSFDSTFIDFGGIDGWKKAYVDGTNDILPPGNPVYFYNSLDSYIELENGKKLYANTVWNSEHGFGTAEGLFGMEVGPEGYSVTFEDGAVMTQAQIENAEFSTIYFPTLMAFPRYDLNVVYKVYSAVEDLAKHDNITFIYALKDMFAQNGLSFRTYDGDFFSKSILSIYNGSSTVSEVYEIVTGETFSNENLIAFRNSAKNAFMPLASYLTPYKNAEKIFIHEVQSLPDDFGIISIDDKVSGNLSVSANGLDFSGVNVNLQKSAIFRNSSVYTLSVSFVGDAVVSLEEPFEKVTYNKKAFSIKGKNAGFVALPEGTYYLKASVVKTSETGALKLSNLIEVKASQFAEFEKTYTTEEGTYKVTYSYENGKVKAVSRYVDETAPTLVVEGGSENDGTYVVAFDETPIIAELISKLSGNDNKDGKIYLNESALTLNGNAVRLNEEVTPGETYVVTIKDSSGNIATFNLVVAIRQ